MKFMNGYYMIPVPQLSFVKKVIIVGSYSGKGSGDIKMELDEIDMTKL